MSTVIALRGVSKQYPSARSGPLPNLREAFFGTAPPPGAEEIVALEPLDLDIGDGERIGIIGPNGAGKTTLLRLIAGLAPPSTGEVEVNGRVYAVLSMGNALRQEVTGRESVFLDGEIAGRTREESAALVDEVAEFTELGEFFDRPVSIYSSGMRARLAFALASVAEPDILIIDEVLSVGDASFNKKASRRMESMAAASKVVLVVSHGMGAIEDMCNRCLWLDHGRLLADGPVAKVVAAYEAEVEKAKEHDLYARFEARRLPAHLTGSNPVTRVALETEGRLAGDRVDSDDSVDAVVRGRWSADTLAVDLAVRIQRLDGLVVHADRIEAIVASGRAGSEFAFAMAMRPVGLIAGTYRLEVSLWSAGSLIGQGEFVFEVALARALIGGVPLVLYPSHLERVEPRSELVSELVSEPLSGNGT